MKNRKIAALRYVVYLLVALCLLILPFHEKNYFVDMVAIEDTLAKTVNDEYVKLSEGDELRKFYQLSSEDADRWILYIPATSMRVNEILVIEAAEGKAEFVKEAIENRRDKQKTSFEGYGVQQCELLDRSILKQYGDFYIYIVGEDAGTLIESVEQHIVSREVSNESE